MLYIFYKIIRYIYKTILYYIEHNLETSINPKIRKTKNLF